MMTIPTDKLLHASVSCNVMVFLCALCPIWWSALLTLEIGAAKEVYDKCSGKGNAEWQDLLADAVGIVAGGVIAAMMA